MLNQRSLSVGDGNINGSGSNHHQYINKMQVAHKFSVNRIQSRQRRPFVALSHLKLFNRQKNALPFWLCETVLFASDDALLLFHFLIISLMRRALCAVSASVQITVPTINKLLSFFFIFTTIKTN